MSALNPGVYKAILRVREAYLFDIGCFLMRFMPYMMNIGTITMLTLAGHSFFLAGLVSSCAALATFLFAPRVSKLVDAFGQSRVVPWAGLVVLIGLVLMLLTVSLSGPVWMLFVSAALLGCVPAPQALARARWTYLIRSGRLGSNAPELRTMFSYEGVLDDIGFMFSPSISIALASGITPVAGMLFGGIAFLVGMVALLLSRTTEPVPGWDADGEGESREAARGIARRKSVFRTSAVVRLLFVLMMFLGAFYAVFDTATVSFAEEAGDPNIASIVLLVSSFVSMGTGFLFGMLNLRRPPSSQLLLFAVLIGCAYGTMILIESIPALFVVATLAAFTYAPFIIVANGACERAVPGERLTEAITWLNAGVTCGMAFGPTVGGAIIDHVSTAASFDFGGLLAIAIPVTALLFRHLVRREVRS